MFSEGQVNLCFIVYFWGVKTLLFCYTTIVRETSLSDDLVYGQNDYFAFLFFLLPLFHFCTLTSPTYAPGAQTNSDSVALSQWTTN